MPGPPATVSLPSPGRIVSLPAWPSSMLARSLPTSVSLPCVPAALSMPESEAVPVDGPVVLPVAALEPRFIGVPPATNWYCTLTVEDDAGVSRTVMFTTLEALLPSTGANWPTLRCGTSLSVIATVAGPPLGVNPAVAAEIATENDSDDSFALSSQIATLTFADVAPAETATSADWSAT